MTDETTSSATETAAEPFKLSDREAEIAGLSPEDRLAYEKIVNDEAAGIEIVFVDDDDEATVTATATATETTAEVAAAAAAAGDAETGETEVETGETAVETPAGTVETPAAPAAEASAAEFDDSPVPVPRALPKIDADALREAVAAADASILDASAKFDSGDITAEELARLQIEANKARHAAQRQLDRYEDAVEDHQAAIAAAQAGLNHAFEQFAKTPEGAAFVSNPAMYAALSADLVRRQQAGQIFGRSMGAVLAQSVQAVREQVAKALGITLPAAGAAKPAAEPQKPAAPRRPAAPGGPKVLAEVPAGAPNVETTDEWSKYRAMSTKELEASMRSWPQDKIDAFMDAEARRYG